MQTVEQTVASAQEVIHAVRGSYFTLLQTTLGVDVTLYYHGQKISSGEMKSMLSGLEVKLPSGRYFDEVRIRTNGADTVKFGYGDGTARYNRAQGDVRVMNNNSQNWLAATHTIGSVSANLRGIRTGRRYILIQNKGAGRIWLSMAGGAATTNMLLLEPGQSYEQDNFVAAGFIDAIGDGAGGANNVYVLEGWE